MFDNNVIKHKFSNFSINKTKRREKNILILIKLRVTKIRTSQKYIYNSMFKISLLNITAEKYL